MIPHNRIATHPGVILLKECLEPLELTQKALATHVGIPVRRVNEIVRGVVLHQKQHGFFLGHCGQLATSALFLSWVDLIPLTHQQPVLLRRDEVGVYHLLNHFIQGGGRLPSQFGFGFTGVAQ